MAISDVAHRYADFDREWAQAGGQEHAARLAKLGGLIRDHHEGYISWAEFERNQELIADNANGKRFMSRGAVRPGEALLPGLLRCARCGKKLRVRYGQTYRYECVGAFNQLAAVRYITFGGMRIVSSPRGLFRRAKARLGSFGKPTLQRDEIRRLADLRGYSDPCRHFKTGAGYPLHSNKSSRHQPTLR